METNYIKIPAAKPIFSLALVALIAMSAMAMPLIIAKPAESLNYSSVSVIVDDENATILNIQINPILNGDSFDGRLRIAIHDLSTCPSSRIVTDYFDSVYNAEFKVDVNQRNPWIGLYVHISDGEGKYSGGTTVYIDVQKGVNEVKLDVNLTEVMSLSAEQSDVEMVSDGISQGGMTDRYTDIEYEEVWLPAGEVHSIQGITVDWQVEHEPDTILYYQSYEKTVWYNNYPTLHYVGETNWSDTGKMPTDSNFENHASVSNGAKKIVEVHIRYNCEEWWYGPDIGNPYIEEYYYFMYPDYFDAVRLGDDVSCDYCNIDHPYGGIWTSGGDNPFGYEFENDIYDNTQWKVQGVDLSFGFSLKTLTFGFGIALYRAGGPSSGDYAPYVIITVNSGTVLYYWYDNNDPTSYVAHFSRT